MTTEIHVNASAAIHEGQLEKFKALATQCVELVRANEPGALEYNWFLNEAQTRCVVRETYRDSQSVLAHVANLGATFGELLATADWSFEIYGAPTAELVQATAALPLTIYTPFQIK